jgi:hypothetical protein
MNNRFSLKSIFLIFIFFLLMIGISFCGKAPRSNAALLPDLPRLSPDYVGVVIPPNIAPMNFVIQEPAERYYVKISSAKGKAIILRDNSAKVIIPTRAWKRLLNANRGNDLQIDIAMRDKDKTWSRFPTIVNPIAKEEIDSYLAYRLITPAYNNWRIMGLYQRNLETFRERPFLLNRVTDNNCMNCHNFCGNDPDNMIFHMRAGRGSGMMLLHDGKLSKVNTATDFNKAGAYPSWHPNKNLVALSVNSLILFFHAIGESRDVLDMGSDIVVYNISANQITTSPKISGKEYMETFPCWSPEGNYLYFCRTKPLDDYMLADKSDIKWDQIHYDLVRIPYDPVSDTWGEVEMLLSEAATGKSATMPRVSPDGKYLLFCLSDYSNFPIYLNSADLYLMDLANRKFTRLPVNSERAETFHSWSSNSRWFVFSSKRDDGMCARPYFSYLDSLGTAHKPFILPQKDPEFYRTYLITYNVPEMAIKPIPVNWRKVTRAAFDSKKLVKAQLDPKVKSQIPAKPKEAKPEQKWNQAPQ